MTGSQAGTRSEKSLTTARDFNRYQRDWFATLRERVGAGEPFAVVNADAPQEILRAMDIPYVVNQWWASVCAAKQMAPRYLELLRARGYPGNSERYSALSFASCLDTDAEDAPWGGLPTPTLLLAEVTGDAQRKLFEAWARETGATFFALEKTVVDEPYPYWWERSAYGWEELIGAESLDLMVEELRGLIRFLETTTGRRFSETRFRRVMDLVNEQQAHNRDARDLIARTVPCPVSIADTIPSVMVPQWHRGTEWGRDAARRFSAEVAERVAQGACICPDERVRMMWIGTGLWWNLGFYQHFQETYGAVFVWSMYLAIAADGYVRHGRSNPVRTLAARFAAFTEQLNAPPWNAEWYLKEALAHGIDGVVHLVGDSPRGGYFITRALESAGIPVLEIHAENIDARDWDEHAMTAAVSAFIEERALPGAQRGSGR